MRAHLLGRVVALGAVVVGVLALAVAPAEAAGLGRATVPMAPLGTTGNVLVGVLALVVIALGVAWCVWEIRRDRTAETVQEAVATPIPLRAQASEEPEKTRKAA